MIVFTSFSGLFAELENVPLTSVESLRVSYELPEFPSIVEPSKKSPRISDPMHLKRHFVNVSIVSNASTCFASDLISDTFRG